MKTWKLISSIDSILNFLWWANIVCFPIYVIIALNSFSKYDAEYIGIYFAIPVDNSSRAERKIVYPEDSEIIDISIIPKSSTLFVNVEKSTKYYVLYWVNKGICFLVYMFSLYYLRKLFRNFTDEDYFSYRNSLYIKYIAFIVASNSLFTWGYQYLGKVLLSKHFPSQADSISWGFGDGVSYLLIGIAIYILADVFRLAAAVEEKKEQLQTENEEFI